MLLDGYFYDPYLFIVIDEIDDKNNNESEDNKSIEG